VNKSINFWIKTSRFLHKEYEYELIRNKIIHSHKSCTHIFNPGNALLSRPIRTAMQAQD